MLEGKVGSLSSAVGGRARTSQHFEDWKPMQAFLCDLKEAV